MVTRRLLAVAAGGALLAAACTSGAPQPRAAPAARRTASRQANAARTHRHPEAAAGPVRLAFAGDVNFAARTARLLSHPATAFGPIASVLKSAGFTAVNLETAVTGRGRPQPKTYHFRTTPLDFTALRDAGVDLVTLANNHLLDYGRTGLADTLAAAKTAGFPMWE